MKPSVRRAVRRWFWIGLLTVVLIVLLTAETGPEGREFDAQALHGAGFPGGAKRSCRSRQISSASSSPKKPMNLGTT